MAALANSAGDSLYFESNTPGGYTLGWQPIEHVSDATSLALIESNDWISPVGEAWRLVLNTTSMVLHSGDNSHPNLNGSYLGACVFYACIFGKSPVGLPFTGGLLPDSALILQEAADSIVFGFASQWNLWKDQREVVARGKILIH